MDDFLLLKIKFSSQFWKFFLHENLCYVYHIVSYYCRIMMLITHSHITYAPIPLSSTNKKIDKQSMKIRFYLYYSNKLCKLIWDAWWDTAATGAKLYCAGLKSWNLKIAPYLSIYRLAMIFFHEIKIHLRRPFRCGFIFL